MYDADCLLDLHERSHACLEKLIAHCGKLSPDELNRELAGFGYPCVRLQLHHVIGAQKYWIGVLEGRLDVEENDPLYPTIESLERYRREVDELARAYLRGASREELNTPRPMTTWDGQVRRLMPAHVFLRTVTHIFHHQGQVLAMCRLLGKPANGFDFPIV